MFRNQDQENAGPEVQNYARPLLSPEGEKNSSIEGRCWSCIAEATFWVLMAALAYLLCYIGIAFAIP